MSQMTVGADIAQKKFDVALPIKNKYKHVANDSVVLTFVSPTFKNDRYSGKTGIALLWFGVPQPKRGLGTGMK